MKVLGLFDGIAPLQTSRNTAMTMRTIDMASRKPAPTPVAIPTVVAGKLSSVNCTFPPLELG